MEENQNMLLDLEEEIAKPSASVGQRLLNFIVDTIAYYILCYVVGAIFIAMYLIGNAEDLARARAGQPREVQGGTIQLILFFGFIFFIILYYVLFEKITKGRSIGKYITGTKVISDDGNPLSWKQAILRSLIRFVPFEPLSAFGGNPWHDQWTNTRVIKIK